MVWLARSLDGLQWMAERIIIIAFAIMVLAITGAVFSRNLSVSITWFEELARFMQVWFVGLGLAVATRRGLLSGAEVVLAVLPPKAVRVILLVAKISILITALTVAVTGWPLLERIWISGQTASNIRISMTWVYIGLWLGFVLTAIFVAGSLILEVFGHRDTFATSFAASALQTPEAALDEEARALLQDVREDDAGANKGNHQ
ncbi:TRAP transporter small permease [Hoeflea sp.]|uniref:TRAP transporter small permease n=1 Tax=Hoeflea sp. TaxID=1940281 RepID=UPI003BAE84C2